MRKVIIFNNCKVPRQRVTGVELREPHFSSLPRHHSNDTDIQVNPGEIINTAISFCFCFSETLDFFKNIYKKEVKKKCLGPDHILGFIFIKCNMEMNQTKINEL